MEVFYVVGFRLCCDHRRHSVSQFGGVVDFPPFSLSFFLPVFSLEACGSIVSSPGAASDSRR